MIMIPTETTARIRRLFYVEHWKIGTIAANLDVHPDTVRAALETDRFNRGRVMRATLADPFISFVQDTLKSYPRLRATRLFQMLRVRGYKGSLSALRRVVTRIRPTSNEAFLRLHSFPGEQGQVDWAHFGQVRIGRACRRLSCFVLTLSYSRACYLEFFFDQTLENFLRGHVRAFEGWGGTPRIILHDNLRSAVLERHGDAVRFHPRMVELSGHYHFALHPCRPARGNEKGRVERTIQYIRHSFFAARPFTTLADFNRQALLWRDQVAHKRPWPGDDSLTVEQAFEREKQSLIPLPNHPLETDLLIPVRTRKIIYVRFDQNDYSIPHQAVGRTLTLVASDTLVRILDGSAEIARHNRSYDRHEIVEDPQHSAALLASKRRARGATAATRLVHVVPETEAFIESAMLRGESAGSQTIQLMRLLDEYGAEEVRAAVQEAIKQDTPRAASVAFLLSKRRRVRDRRLPVPVDLSRHPELADVDVRPHDYEVYDELSSHSRDDD
jgi:transposase